MKGANIPHHSTLLTIADWFEPRELTVQTRKVIKAWIILIVKYRKICLLPGTILHPQYICIFQLHFPFSRTHRSLGMKPSDRVLAYHLCKALDAMLSSTK
jgi:hypothetical protein